MPAPAPLREAARSVRPSATLAIQELSQALTDSGREVLRLGLGQSPFPIPERVVESLRANAEQKDYLPVQGLPTLREAVARHAARTIGIERTADDVLLGPGSKELMFLLQLVQDGPLVIPAPSWVTYAPQALLVGRAIENVPTTRHNGWMLTAEALDAHMTANPKPGLLILNYPNNPTGQTFSASELEAIAEVSRRHALVVLSDEIYGEVSHSAEHVSVAKYYPEGTIVSGGLSKWCGAGGWRFGTFIFPEELAWIRRAMVGAASETFSSVAAPIQHAAMAAFDGGEDIEDYLRRSRLVLQRLGRHCADTLESAGIHTTRPDGGFYLFLDFSDHRETLARRGITDGVGITRALLEEKGVAFLPGEEFGRAPEDLTARIAYVDFDGGEALKNTGAEAPAASAFAPRVVEAIRRITEWVKEGEGK